MKLSFFLAKFFGVYSLILGFYWVSQKDKLQKASKDLFSSPALLSLTGMFGIICGVLVLIIHPIFEWDFRLLITVLFGIFPLVKGAKRLFLQKETSYTKKIINGTGRVYVGVFLLLVGAFLAYTGFCC